MWQCPSTHLASHVAIGKRVRKPFCSVFVSLCIVHDKFEKHDDDVHSTGCPFKLSRLYIYAMAHVCYICHICIYIYIYIYNGFLQTGRRTPVGRVSSACTQFPSKIIRVQECLQCITSPPKWFRACLSVLYYSNVVHSNVLFESVSCHLMYIIQIHTYIYTHVNICIYVYLCVLT